MRTSRPKLLPLLAILAGALSAGLLLWSRSHGDFSWEPAAASVSVSADGPGDAGNSATSGNPAAQANANPSPDMANSTGTAEETTSGKEAPTTADAGPITPPPATADSSKTPESASIPSPPSPSPSPTPLPTEDELAGPLPTQNPNLANAAPPPPVLHSSSVTPGQPGQPERSSPGKPDPELNLAALVKLPQYWPRQIVLQAAVRFPVFLNGHEAGNIRVPPGAIVKLVKLRPDGQAEVERQGTFATVPATSTDLLSRAAALRLQSSQGAFVSPAPPATASLAPAGPATPGPSPLAAGETSATPAPADAPVPIVAISVRRDRRSATGPENAGRKTWSFHIRVQNQTSRALSEIHGRFFLFSRGKEGSIILAANEKLACKLEPNGEAALEPLDVTLDDATPFESYAIVLRDADGAVAGSSSTRESITRQWEALEAMKPGAVLSARGEPRNQP